MAQFAIDEILTTGIAISGFVFDVSNNIGANGYVLTSTSSGVMWQQDSSNADLSSLSGQIAATGTLLNNRIDSLSGYVNGTFLSGSGVANYVARWSNTKELLTGSIYDLGTGIGIGTTSPAAKFNVYGGNTVFRNDVVGGTSAVFIRNWASSPSTSLIFGNNTNDDSSTTLDLTANVFSITNYGDPGSSIKFGTRNNSTADIRVTIDPSGRVGIGATNLSSLLTVGGAGSANSFSGISFGEDSSANLYRISTARLQTDGSLTIGGQGGLATALTLNRSSTSNENGIAFNSLGSTDWYFYVDGGNTHLQIQRSSEIDSAPRVRFDGANSNVLFNLGGGNVGIGTPSPNTKLRISGSFSQRASGSPPIQEYKNIVTYNSDNYTTGAYVVRTPFQIGNSYEMPIVHVKGYGYGDAKLYDFKVVFYDYGPSHAPISYSLIDLGNDGSPKYLAKDASNYINVCFGQTGDVHYYYRFTVDCITTRQENDYSQGWGMYQTKVANFGFASTGIYALNSPINFRTNLNVGIGTTNPTTKLNVYDSSPTIRLQDSNTNVNAGVYGTIDWLSSDSSMPGGLAAKIDVIDDSSFGGDRGALRFFTNNATSLGERMRISSNGNVGIGTASAVAQFHIGGTASNNNPWMVLDVNDTFFKRIIFSEERPAYGITGYGGYLGYDAAANTISLGTYHETGEYRALNILRQNGYIGIGTTNPSSSLTIYDHTNGATLNLVGRASDDTAVINFRTSGDLSTYAYVAPDTNEFRTYHNDGFMSFYPGGSEKVRFTAAGNVGIGVTNPTVKLQVTNTGTVSSIATVRLVGSTGNNAGSQIEFYKAQNPKASIGLASAVTGGLSDDLLLLSSNPNSIVLTAGSSGLAVFKPDGKVGIGIYNPISLLSIGGFGSTSAVSGITFGLDAQANLYRSAEDIIKTDGSLDVTSNLLVGSDLYVADELGVGVPIASKRFNYGAEIGAASASIQLVLGRLSSATGQGGIGADASNTFAVWNVSGQTTKQFVITQQGNVGIGSETPTQKLDVSGTLKIKSAGTYSDPTDNAGFLNYDTVGGIFTLSARSDGGNTYMAFRTSNGGTGSEKVRIANNGNVGIGTPSPLAPLHVGLGGDWPSTTGTSAMVFIKQNTSTAGLIIQEPGDASSDRVLHLYANGSLATIEGTYRDTGPYPHLAFRTSGTERMRIASNGLVGISSTVPTDFLDFGGAGKNIVFGYAAYGEVLNSAASIIGNNVKASPTANSQVRRFANANDQGNFIKLIYNKGVTFHTNIISALNTDISEDTNERMRINLSGDVGIGAINPIYRLQLQANNPTNGVLAQFYNFNAGAAGANGAFSIWTQYGIADWFIGQPSGVNALTFGRDKTSSATGVEYMRINSAGNVGIGINNPSVKLAVNGEASFGDGSKLTLIGLDINDGATPSFIKIRTKIPFASPAADFTVNIKGFRYNSAETTNLSICWHYYLSTFYSPSISSAGSFAPIVKLSAEDWDSSGTPKVCIVLVGPGYWPKLYVESMYSSAYNDEYADGWDWIDADATGTGNNLATLAYKSNFGNNFLMLNNGYVGIGSANPTQRLDVGGYVMAGEGLYRTSTYGTNGGAWISFGDTGVLDSLGRVGAYGALFNINSINGDTSFQYNGSEKMRITTAGNVGIGVTNPGVRLQVVNTGSVTSTSTVRIVGATGNGGGSQIEFFKGTSQKFSIGTASAITGGFSDDLLITTLNPSSIILTAGLSGLAVFKTDGKVGIGMYNPTTLLSVGSAGSTTAASGITFGADAQVNLYRSAENVLKTDGSLIITDSLGLGISPTQKLQVDGVVGNPALNGTTQSGIFRISNTTDNAVLDFGIRAGGSGAWVQSTDETSLGAYYPLLLNPNGGNVGIGTLTPSHKLHVYARGNGAGILIESDPTDDANQAPALKLYPKSPGSSERNWAISPFRNYAQSLSISSSDAKGGDPYSNGTTRLIIDGINGNVGVGTISPIEKLHVSGNIHVQAESNSIGGNGIYLGGATTRFLAVRQTSTNKNFAFDTYNDTESWVNRLTILNNGGNVGIGTAVPNSILELYKVPATSGTLQPMLTITSDYPSAITTNFGSSIVFKGRTAGNEFQDNAQIAAYNENNNDNGYALGFYTRPTVAGGLQQRMTILRGGNVGIDTTSPNAKLQIAGTTASLLTVGTLTNDWGGVVAIGTPNGNGIILSKVNTTNDTNRVLTLMRDDTNGASIFGYTPVGTSTSIGFQIRASASSYFNGGNVGIGQTSPLEKLQVQGNIYATDGALFNFKAQRIPIEGSPQGGTYKGYLILAKAYTSGFLEASYVIGKVILRRGTSGTGHNVDIYEVNSSRGYNTEIFQVSRLGAIGTRFVRLVKVTYGGVVYHAIETSDSGGQPSTEMYFEGSIIDSPLILTDASFVSNVAAFGDGVIFVDQSSNIGIGTTSPDVKLHVRGEQVYLYNDLNTNNTYFYARNSSAGNAGIKMKNSQGEWTIIANDRLRFIDDDAGVERLSILSNGNVGIGIVAPTDKIQISGGGISFTTSTGLAVPMLGVTALNVAYVGPYATPTDGNAPSTVLFNHGASVQQTWFYSSGSVAMVLNRQGRLHIGNLNNAPNCLLSVGPSSSTTAVSGMCFGNDAEANLYRSAEDTIKTDGNLIVVGNVTAANLVSGNGTANFITKWNGTKSIANSQIFDDGTYVGVNTAVNTTYRLQVNGSFAATTKSFDIVHPTISGKRLIYASLEGPENGVYFRGRNNNNEINLPHYWSGLVHDDSITVDLTSVGKRKDGKIRNYSVDQIGHNKVYIYTDSDDNIYDYYYTIFAERKDVSRLITERDME